MNRGKGKEVHTYPFSLENATFSLRIRLPFTRTRWKRLPKTHVQLSENALQSGNFWKRRFRVPMCTVENGSFPKRWRAEYWTQPNRAKENGKKWRLTFLLGIKQLCNILGCQKQMQSYCTIKLFTLEINSAQQTCRIAKHFFFLLKFSFKKEFNFFVRQKKCVSLTIFTRISLLWHIQTARNYRNKKLKWHHVAPLAFLPHITSAVSAFSNRFSVFLTDENDLKTRKTLQVDAREGKICVFKRKRIHVDGFWSYSLSLANSFFYKLLGLLFSRTSISFLRFIDREVFYQRFLLLNFFVQYGNVLQQRDVQQYQNILK